GCDRFDRGPDRGALIALLIGAAAWPRRGSGPRATRADAQNLCSVGVLDLSDPAANLGQRGLDRLVFGAAGTGLSLLLFRFGNERTLGPEDRPQIGAALFLDASMSDVGRRVSGEKVRDLV